MKLLKKPFIALILAVLMVISSTLLSVNIKLGNKCQDIYDMFYYGVVYDGVQHESIGSQLNLINASVANTISIADKYGINTEDAACELDDLKLALMYSENEISYIYYCYSELREEADKLIEILRRASISETDLNQLDNYAAVIDQAIKKIDTAGYNEAVKEFLREYSRFPSGTLKELAGVTYPDYFA